MSRLAVFGGVRNEVPEHFLTEARDLGAALANAGFSVVCGGVSGGVLGALIDGIVDGSGTVFGVVASEYRQQRHPRVSEVRYVGTIADRIGEIVGGAAGVIVLPGGMGTLEETFVAWRLLAKADDGRCMFALNSDGVLDELVAHLDRLTSSGFITPTDRERLVTCPSAETLLDQCRLH